MSISAFAISQEPIASATAEDSKKTKVPPKRQIVAKADLTANPEPR
ncbi:MAG TPA: hypothetical protein VM265_07850 [Sphingomicrobium sp.]|nr:hypothetical protein [Sphingomicrobium sp.]